MGQQTRKKERISAPTAENMSLQAYVERFLLEGTWCDVMSDVIFLTIHDRYCRYGQEIEERNELAALIKEFEENDSIARAAKGDVTQADNPIHQFYEDYRKKRINELFDGI